VALGLTSGLRGTALILGMWAIMSSSISAVLFALHSAQYRTPIRRTVQNPECTEPLLKSATGSRKQSKAKQSKEQSAPGQGPPLIRCCQQEVGEEGRKGRKGRGGKLLTWWSECAWP